MKNYENYLIDDFLIEKEINEGLSIATIKTYTTVLNVLVDNPYVDIDFPETITELNFKKLLGEQLKKNNWTSHTYNRYRKNLKVFCDYLVKQEYIRINPLLNIKPRKIEKTLPKHLNIKQVLELKKVINNTFNDCEFLTIRNKTILYMYLYTGLRLYELIELKFENIDFLNGQIRIVHGKGGKERFVPLIYKLGDILIPYLLSRKKQYFNTDYLFNSKSGGIMRHRDIYAIIKKFKSKLSFKLTPHMLRHTFATELVRKNINIYNVSRVLGHSRLETTKIYLNLDLDTVKISMNNARLFSK